jgi:hypothetical protein
LNRSCGYIAGCRIAIEKPQKHHRSGSSYRIRFDIPVPPSNELVFKREAGEEEIHEEFSAVISKVFFSTPEAEEVQWGEVKTHSREEMPGISGEFDNFTGNH